MRKTSILAGLVLISASFASAQLLDVKIVQRQDQQTQYTYEVAGHSTTTSDANAHCYGSGDSVNCNGGGTSNTTTTAPHAVTYSVTGATFSLSLPDGRVAVVNCTSKFAEHFAGVAGNKRSCRMPIVDNIQAMFKGDSAKLMWPVSLDGKKTESETYKILGILPGR